MRAFKLFSILLSVFLVSCSDLFGPGYGCSDVERVCLTELSTNEISVYTGASGSVTIGGTDGSVYTELLIAPSQQGRFSYDDRSIRLEGEEISGNPSVATAVAYWHIQEKTEFNIYVFPMNDNVGVVEYTVYPELRPKLKRKFTANIIAPSSSEAFLMMEMGVDERRGRYVELIEKDLESRGIRNYTLKVD